MECRTLASFRKWPDLTWRRFGHLIVERRAIKAEEPTDRYRSDWCRWWICRCDCGNTRAVNTKRLCSAKSRVTGCGCMGKKKAFGEAAKWQFFTMVRANAKRRKKSFSLTLEEFLRLTGASCVYCGIEWSSEYPTAKRFNGIYRHNGIDRIDSKIGYVADNCTTACATCNYAKAEMTIKEFSAWIERVHRNFVKPVLAIE